MACRAMNLGDGTGAIICARGRRLPRCQVPGCAGEGTRLCDFVLSGAKKGKTCDMRLCGSHSTRPQGAVGPDAPDYCPAHARLAHGGIR